MGTFVERLNRKKYLLPLFLLVYFSILTAIFTRPLVSRLATHTTGGYGDNHYFIWIIGWAKQALFELGQSPHKSFLLNHPYGYQLALTEITPLQVFIALPFAYIFDNPVLGYNIAMLSAFILSGLFMFYWVRHLTGSFYASLIASTAYALLPYLLAHMLSGHLNLVPVQWFPLYFWGLFEILEDATFSWKNVLLMAVGLSAIALTSQYYLFMTLFISMLLFIIKLLRKRFRLKWVTWKALFIAGMIALPALLVGTIPYYLVHGGGSTNHPLTDVMIYSASILDYLLPFTKNPFLGKWLTARFPRDLWGEATLYLGLPVILLMITALVVNQPQKKRPVMRHIALVGLIAFILSLGTNLTWMEQPVVLTTPYWLQWLIKHESFYLYMPGYLLYQYFPFYDIMRAWMRYGVIAMVMACSLAGIGAEAFLRKIKPSFRLPLTIILLTLVLLDFSTTPLALVEIKPRPVDYWLAEQPQGGQVQLPLAQSFEIRSFFYTLTNQKPLIGQLNHYPSNRYFQLQPIFSQFPNAASIQRMKEEQINYVLVESSMLKPEDIDTEYLSSLGIGFAGDFDGISVFLIP